MSLVGKLKEVHESGKLAFNLENKEIDFEKEQLLECPNFARVITVPYFLVRRYSTLSAYPLGVICGVVNFDVENLY